MSRSRMIGLVLGALALLPAPARSAEAEHPEHVPARVTGEDLDGYVEGAARLEGRIMAPCCWNQTIDIHGSEPAYELRREIRRRLRAGESSSAIEESLKQRYGARILAVPDSSPLAGLATVLAVVFGGVGVAGYFMLQRWSRAGKLSRTQRKADEKAVEPGAKPDALDERLDRELSDIADQA